MNPKTGYIDYDQLEENARLFHPKLIIAGKEQPLHTSRGGILKPVGNCSGMLQNYRIESLNNPSWKGPTRISQSLRLEKTSIVKSTTSVGISASA